MRNEPKWVNLVIGGTRDGALVIKWWLGHLADEDGV